MKIEHLTVNDSKKLLSLEKASFSKPWSEEAIRDLLLSERAVVFGAFEGEELRGYSVLEWVLDEGSLTNIAVDPLLRRRGYASALMEKTIALAKEKNMSVILLEVRTSNESAINLYRKFGFEEVSVRRNYYSAPTEDALLMTLSLN